VLQDGEVLRVGGGDPRPVDVRVVAGRQGFKGVDCPSVLLPAARARLPPPAAFRRGASSGRARSALTSSGVSSSAGSLFPCGGRHPTPCGPYGAWSWPFTLRAGTRVTLLQEGSLYRGEVRPASQSVTLSLRPRGHRAVPAAPSRDLSALRYRAAGYGYAGSSSWGE
jgi:hypothetical protein